MGCAHQNAGAAPCAHQNAGAMGCAPSARSALVLSSAKEPLPPRFTHGKIPIAPRPSPERHARTRFVIRAPLTAQARWCVCPSKRMRAPPGELRGARHSGESAAAAARAGRGVGFAEADFGARVYAFMRARFFLNGRARARFFFGGRRPVGARGGLARRRSRTHTKRPGSGSPHPPPLPASAAERDARRPAPAASTSPTTTPQRQRPAPRAAAPLPRARFF